MSLHYLLDGYNILHQIPELLLLEIDQQRLVLVREIEKHQPHGSGRNKVTLIFDGRPGRAQPITSTAVTVIFSMDRSADDRIREMVQGSGQVKNMIVVTDDRELQYSVRASGAKVLSVREFMGRLRGTQVQTRGKKLTQRQKDQINAELEDRWLKGGGDSD
ncbi:MAG: NYN domain-containing protein [Candidatus Omnitrophica bacterium]|nr:NYN domain-containing protein [Candidatus Omnitrophota bacterium]